MPDAPRRRHEVSHDKRCWVCRPPDIAADLVSTQEIAQRLGVKKQTVHTWRSRGVLPEPDFDLGVGPVWLWDTIEEWAKMTGRLPKFLGGEK